MGITLQEAAFSLAMYVVATKSTLDNVIDSELTSQQLADIAALFDAAVKCRQKLFAEARKTQRDIFGMTDTELAS